MLCLFHLTTKLLLQAHREGAEVSFFEAFKRFHVFQRRLSPFTATDGAGEDAERLAAAALGSREPGVRGSDQNC